MWMRLCALRMDEEETSVSVTVGSFFFFSSPRPDACVHAAMRKTGMLVSLARS